MDFSQLNIWAVLLAAVVKFFIGGLWYSPILFGKQWMTATGLKEDELGSPAKPMIITALLGVVTAFTLSVLITLANPDFAQSIALGFVVAIGIVVAMLAPHFLFEGRSMRLFAIYAGQHVVELMVMAAIIGGWR